MNFQILQALKEHHRLYFKDGEWIRFDQHDAASCASSSIGLSLSTEESDLVESSILDSVGSVVSEEDDHIEFNDFYEDIQGTLSE